MFKGNIRHGYHLVNTSMWPMLSSFSAFFFVSGLAFYMHKIPFGGIFLLYGLACLAYCVFFWFNDIIDEATKSGYHTTVVCMGLRFGFVLFVISEVMLFFGFFWAFFHAALCPSIAIGSIFPPVGITTIDVLEFPLYNTMVLLVSGAGITWTHHGVVGGSMSASFDSFLIVLFLGFYFVGLQICEYYEATFNFCDTVYSCSFFMLTGLHGCHVFAGAVVLSVCLIRLIWRHFLVTHHLGLLFGIWYWHFVDVVWIFLFITVYCWGSW